MSEYSILARKFLEYLEWWRGNPSYEIEMTDLFKAKGRMAPADMIFKSWRRSHLSFYLNKEEIARFEQEVTWRRFLALLLPLYYESSLWNKIKNDYMRCHRSACELCGDTTSLEIHHKTYERWGGIEEFRDLQLLCRKCHESVSTKMGQEWSIF